MICQNQSGHSFYNWYSAGDYAWVVAALAGNFGGIALAIDRGLALHDGGNGFKSHPELDRHAVADASLYAAGEVGDGFDVAISVDENIIMLGTAHFAACEAGTELEAMYSVDT